MTVRGQGYFMPRVYLDMDGVLMDFDNHITGWLQPPWTGRIYHHLPPAEWTAEETTNDLRYQNAMADPKFWLTMKPMADAHLLWDHCRTLSRRVLTATPSNATYRDRCAADKMFSINHHFDPVFPQEHFHAVLRSEKKRFAEGNVLVDDLPGNCKEWTAAGGIAILHKDAVSTIRILQELIHV